MSRLFLSYARADRDRVAPLARVLEGEGHEVWWDALMEGGAAFAQVIEERLDAADAVIVVWSERSIRSDWVCDEAGRGRDRTCLVPVTLDGVQPPLGFRQYHAIDLSRWKGDAHAPELEALRAGLARCGATGTGPTASRPTSRRAIIAGGTAVTAAAAAGAGWRWWRGSGGGPDNTIAVLPFSNLSESASQAYFADGLAEELRSALMRSAAVQVAAPTSSAAAGKSGGDARAIASTLGVAYLLMGSVRRQGDQVRIAAELIDGVAGFSKWSRQFDERLDDVFAVQRTIADAVADAIAVRFDRSKAELGGTADARAYDAYLQGLALFNADTGEASDRGALARFDEATDRDPHFARALAARSRALAAIASQYGKADELRPLYDDALATAGRAVTIAPGLAIAQLALGFAKLSGRLDIAGARPAYDQAARLGAGDADVLILTAIYQASTRRDAEARAGIAAALARDPLNPRAFRAASIVHLCAGRYADAIAAAQKALKLAPTLSNAHAKIGIALLMTGKAADALAAFQQERNPGLRFTGLAVAQHRLGNAPAADAAFARLVSEIGDAGAFQQAQVLAQWGRTDAAMAALTTARRLGDAGLIGLVTDPLLLPLRTLPAFVTVARGMGFAT